MRVILAAISLLVSAHAFAAPLALGDKYQTKINNILSVKAPGVMKNDIGFVSVSLAVGPAHGKLVLSSNGSFTYTPFGDYTGPDAFVYTAESGSYKTSAQVSINVYSTARAAVGGSDLACGGDEAELKVDLEGEAPFEVRWSDGVVQQTSGSQITRIVKPDRSTLYVLDRVEDKNGPGPISPSSIVVKVEARPAPPVISGTRGVEAGDPLALVASGNYVSYQWYRNGVAVEGATGRTYSEAEALPSASGVYTVTGRYSQCHSLPSFPVDLVVASRRVIPVIGAAEGAFGSSFRSTVQVANPNDAESTGTLDFYGALPSAPRQTAFSVPPYGTIAFTNVTPVLGSAPLGSVDVSVSSGVRVPDAVTRVYNDAGPLGTTGVNVPQVRLKDVLQPGDAAILIGPANPLAFRFNIGIRTLEAGVTMNIRSYGADGQLRMVVQRAYPENSFRQLPAADLLGIPLTTSGVLRFEIVSGTAVIYGTTIENRTNDPILQLAERVQIQQRQLQMVLPAASSILGAYGAWFKTGVQIHNPGSAPITLTLGFRPALQIAGPTTHNRIYRVEPFATVAIDDVLPALGTNGFGSVDVTVNGATRPVFLARIFNDGLQGQAGTNEPVLTFEDIPRGGDRIVLIAPATPDTLRFNIGIRTLEEGATIDFVVRNAAGAVRHASRREYPTSYLVQQVAPEFFGMPLGANDWIEIRIVHGAAVVYGSTTDNVTQDSSMQIPTR